MSLTNSPFWMASTSAGGSLYDYTIDNSMRLHDVSGSYLYQTEDFATNNTWTFSCWIKRNLMRDRAGSGDQQILHVNNNDPWEAFRWVGSDDSLSFTSYGRGGTTYAVNIYTYPIFRDPSSWYHVMFVYDAGNGTAADRQRIYVNGERMSVEGGRYGSGTGSSNTSTTSNSALGAGYNISIGSRDGNNPDADFQIAEVHFLDGYALTPSSFGETKEGIWVPKEYTGSYGQGGSYLDFADANDLGKDVSGQGNHWSSGSGVSAHDQLPDTPTNNFCTINSIFPMPNITVSDGNLRHSTATNNRGVVGDFLLPKSGKWYFEHWSKSFNYPTDNEMHAVGINQTTVDTDASRGGWATGITLMSSTGKKNVLGTQSTYDSITGWDENEGCGVVYDADTNTIAWTVNGGALGSTVSVPDGDWIPFVGMGGGFSTEVGIFNFGQDGTFGGETTSGNYSDANGYGNFKWQPPTDALALCTANFPSLTIDPASGDKPSNYFNTALYTAATTNGTYDITGVGFQAGMTWVKNRNNVERHFIMDEVRGNQSMTNKFLVPNSTSSEGTNGISGTTVTVNSDGFQVVESSINSGEFYFNGRTYSSWNWLAGGNSDTFNIDGVGYSTAALAGLNTGDITPTGASINTAAGISIISFTGTGATSATPLTINHGLGKKPGMILLKDRDSNSNNNQWIVGHKGLATNGYFYLSDTGQAYTSTSGTVAVSNADATNFGLGVASSPASNTVNESGDDYIVYLFADIEGFSKTGFYYGNSSSDGTYVPCGFRPAWVLIKSTSSGTDWCIYDNKRLGYNVDNNLQRVASAAEQTDDDIDFLSNGFKLRRSSSNFNSATHIFLAFAEQPFKFANAR